MNKLHPEIVLSEAEAKKKLASLTRRGFLVGGAVALAGAGAWTWIRDAKRIGEVPWPQRKVLDWNGRLSEAYLSHSHLMPTFRPDQVEPLKVNGGEGLDDPDGLENWKLVFDPGAGLTPLNLTLSDVQSLPRVDMITNFCCIEGWNRIVHWTGVRFSDFLRKYLPAGYTLPPYVYMATPDEEYYVGMDMKSAVHPQTLLAWQINGEDLTPPHGAPLRLVIPVKYGVKNIKRVGLIRLMQKRAADYWAENGYDWFAGL
jgi:hypothetical protein